MKTKNALLFGGFGQLGQIYKEFLKEKNFEVKPTKVDITERALVIKKIKDFDPEIVFNFAAKTDIDWCKKNKLKCFEVNTLGADRVAGACQELDKYLVHISSGCLQDSSLQPMPYKESDQVSPVCFYSWTKAWADQIIMDRVKRKRLKALILRPRQLVSQRADERNLLTKLLAYDKFIDIPNSCTIIEDMLPASLKLIERRKIGIYNMVNQGTISPFKIAQILKRNIKPSWKFEKISKNELNEMTDAKRIDTVLDISKLEKEGVRMPDVVSRIETIIKKYKSNISQN